MPTVRELKDQRVATVKNTCIKLLRDDFRTQFGLLISSKNSIEIVEAALNYVKSDQFKPNKFIIGPKPKTAFSTTQGTGPSKNLTTLQSLIDSRYTVEEKQMLESQQQLLKEVSHGQLDGEDLRTKLREIVS
jgi:hypothetical protein